MKRVFIVLIFLCCSYEVTMIAMNRIANGAICEIEKKVALMNIDLKTVNAKLYTNDVSLEEFKFAAIRINEVKTELSAEYTRLECEEKARSKYGGLSLTIMKVLPRFGVYWVPVADYGLCPCQMHGFNNIL